jgi:peptidoglycan/xylan/chitin deacetylase (PgdA/CDA1 family)
VSFVCLAYHRISAEPAALADPYTVRPTHFQAQMGWLAGRGYQVLSLDRALASLAGGAGRRPRMAALSFDDGYLDFEQHAWPVLRALGFGATLFVVAGRAGGLADWPGGDGSRLLDWDHLAALAGAGLEIGAHGLQHAPMDAQEPDNRSPDALDETLAQMQSLFARHLGRAPQGLAYPYGRWSAAAAAAVRRAGFAYAATARGGINHPHTPRDRLRRTLITGKDWGALGRLRFAAKVRTGYAHLAEWRMDLRRLP